MRFVDSSVFIHAYLKPKRELKPHEASIKESAKEIVKRINRGERVTMTVVHLGEVSNLVENNLPLREALELEEVLLSRENIEISEVSREDYVEALDFALDHSIGLNDALTCVLMRKSQVQELYSFDRDFDRIEGIQRIQD